MPRRRCSPATGGRRFTSEPREEWTACFARLGFDVDVRGTGEGTPFANVLFVLTRPARASA